MDNLSSSAELWAVLRYSLKASAQSNGLDFDITTADAPVIRPNNPALRPLIEQILFSRRFILTYYAAIGGIVALAAISHIRLRILKWRGRRQCLRYGDGDKGQEHTSRRAAQDGSSLSSVSSSSSSTLQGTQSPSSKGSSKLAIDETTPLISGHNVPPTLLQRSYCRVQALLLYQPAPIPAITSSSNILPDNGTTLLILLFLGLNIFYLFYHTPLSISMLFAFADRAGLCFVANLPILYVLSAKSNQPIKWLTGWSYEGLNIFHRRLGECMIIFAALHTLGMFGVWYTLLRPAHFTLLRFLSSKVILLGLFTILSYIIIWGTSTGIVRQFYYEYFLGVHILVQLAALILLFFHHSGSRPYVLASLTIWALDRVALRMIVSPVKLPGRLKITPDKETVLLTCDIPLKANGSYFSYLQRDIRQGWQPGQHVFVTIPALGLQHKLQTHPFTIASPAPPLRHSNEWPLQLIIRAKDGFSKDLLNFAKSHDDPDASVDIILDGPYGSDDTLRSLRSSDRCFLVAGGSGIAVTYPYAWTLHVNDGPEALVRHSFGAKDEIKIGDVLNATETAKVSTTPENDKFRQIWVRSSHLHLSWLEFWPAYGSMRVSNDSAGNRADMNGYTEQEMVGDLLSSMPPTREGKHTRPDVAREVKDWVVGKPHTADTKGKTTCVVVSGPDGMVRDVRNACADLVRQGWKIECHVEKFGW